MVQANMSIRWIGLVLLAMGCHLGRPAAPTAAFTVGQVVASSTEPGLEDALKSGISAALATREMLNEQDAAPVDIAVLAAVSQPTSAGEASQSFAARLQISVRVEGRSAQFSSERSYTVIDAVQGDAARKAAFEALAAVLTEDAAEWLAIAPKGEDE
jgi:hypothetical protein